MRLQDSAFSHWGTIHDDNYCASDTNGKGGEGSGKGMWRYLWPRTLTLFVVAESFVNAGTNNGDRGERALG